MIQKLLNAIDSLGFPAYLQGSLAETDKYPESFFTFWNFQSEETKTFDNKPVACDWGYWLYFYSTDPILVESVPLQAKELLKAEGFEVWGKGEDVNSDVITHTGRMITIYYHEQY